MDGPREASAYGRRCVARAKSTGEQCRRRPIPGGTVCVVHGGAAAQVALAARRRVEVEAQSIAATKLGLTFTPTRPKVSVPDADAVLRRLRRRQPRWFRAAEQREHKAFQAGVLRHALHLLDEDVE